MTSRSRGFTLLPVVLAMTVVGAIAFLMNRANAINADIVAGRADRERARYAAEAGLQAVNYAVQKAACVGAYPTAAAPLADASFGGAAYSGYASAASGSPLTLTSAGTFNGATVTLTRTVYAYQPTVRTYIYQPGPANGIDTWVDEANAGQNHGASDEIALSALSGGASHELLIRFNLSFFPAGSRVALRFDPLGNPIPAATLELFKNGSGSSGFTTSFIDVHVVPRAVWVEGNGNFASGATWNTYDGANPWASAGSRFDSRVLSRTPFSGNSGWQQFEVTDAAAGWMTPGLTNAGLLLRSSPTAPAMSSRFVSSDSTSDPSKRPKLIINYYLPCGATAPA